MGAGGTADEEVGQGEDPDTPMFGVARAGFRV